MPVPEDLTDFGEIEPFIVATKDIFVWLDKTSLCAGVKKAQSEVIITKTMKLRRMP
jgi:hypothetical protein